ncbi:M43 family zinc metalloprotease [Flavobacterium sp.]|uniref:M43 family zinc metalloprotease n=1 Tax=Flavobacterium sp. TaxID=239 RepID=UPI00286C5055|nr:M43 family zinc metalloprotease [Flavobacterium sp.]
MKNTLRILFLIVPFLSLMAQEKPQLEFSHTTTEECSSDAIHQKMMQTNPGYAARMNAFEASLINPSANKITSAATYIIPVVVHIMHKGEAVGIGTNISDESVYGKIKAINEEYRKISGSLGDGTGVDVGIEFALAVKDPSGACTNGIDRVNMTAYANYMSYGVRLNGSVGMTDAALKAVAFWDSNNYYNIWVVSALDNITSGLGSVGYTYLAPAHGTATDGAVLVSHSFRDIGSKGETHELAHSLNLYHTFEGDGTGNTCPVGNGCGSGLGDCCLDTPPHKRSTTTCNTSGSNSCDANSSNALFVTNYMEYSINECRNKFTADQKTRMVTALTTIRGSLLSANGNDKLMPSDIPVAAFIQNVQSVCSGGTVTFSDKSACIPNTFLNDDVFPGVSFSWTLTSGSTILTSVLQNPSFTLTQTGNYNLAYTVTNSLGSNTINVPNAVVVTAPAIAACVPQSQYVGFYGSTINAVSFNNIQNYTSVMTNVAYTDYSCTKNTILIAGTTYPLTVSFKGGNFTEYLEVYIDYNNNGAFETTEKILASSLATGVLNYITSNIVIPTTAVNNTLLRMRVIGDAATITAANRNCTDSFYTGDIEDYSVYITAALSTENFADAGLHYFPNPVKDFLNINTTSEFEKIQVYNIVGQIVFESNNQSKEIRIDCASLNKGIYLVSVFNKGKKSTLKVIKE